MQFIRKIFADKKGATAIEYGLIAALIAVAAIGAMSSLGTQLGDTFNDVKTNLESGDAGAGDAGAGDAGAGDAGA